MDDAQLIASLGGSTKLAELLGYDKEAGGVQRVHNWRTRGIPPKVKLERPDLFLVNRDQAEVTATEAAQVVEKAA